MQLTQLLLEQFRKEVRCGYLILIENNLDFSTKYLLVDYNRGFIELNGDRKSCTSQYVLDNMQTIKKMNIENISSVNIKNVLDIEMVYVLYKEKDNNISYDLSFANAKSSNDPKVKSFVRNCRSLVIPKEKSLWNTIERFLGIDW